MNEKTGTELTSEDVWKKMLLSGEFHEKPNLRYLFRALPGPPRCKVCYVPFSGTGGYLSKLIFRRYPSNLNPSLCNECDEFFKRYRGGTEVELSLLFADVRGSTEIAEKMTPMEFRNLINRFYITATSVLVHADALIDKIIGDQAAGIFVPGFAGPNHAGKAIEAAQEILRQTGHDREEGPWIPLGIGVHTGVVYIGSLGDEASTSDITVLGDAANTAARLSTSAGTGEILISQESYQAAGLNGRLALEQRDLKLKGKSEGMRVNVLAEFAQAAVENDY